MLSGITPVAHMLRGTAKPNAAARAGNDTSKRAVSHSRTNTSAVPLAP